MKKSYSVILSIIAIINSVSLLALPYIAKYLVDEANNIYKNNASYDAFTKYLILIVVFGVLVIIGRFVYNLTYQHFDLLMQKNLRQEIYDNLIYKDINIINKYHRGEIEALFVGDVDNVCNAYLEAIPGIIRSFSRALLAIVLLILIGGAKYFLLIVLVAGIIMALFARLYSKIMRKKHKEVLDLDSRASSFVIETIDEAKLIQSYNAYSNASDYYKKLNEKAYVSRRNRNRWTYTASSIISAMSSVLYVFMISFGAYLISKDKISYGALVALLAVLNNIYSPILNISPQINKYNRGKASLERIVTIINEESNSLGEMIDDFERIKISNLSYSYDDREDVIKNISFEVKKGDIVRISGPSGIGKSTLLSLILGFNKPQSGKITFIHENEEIEASFKTRGLIAYVSQENILFSGSIADNFKMFSNTDDINLIEDSLHKASIYDEIKSMPDGLNTILADKGIGLSMGQIQRIMIAIAIASGRPIIILDEPTSALDKDNEITIMNNLKALGKTLIYISHRDFRIENEKEVKLVEE